MYELAVGVSGEGVGRMGLAITKCYKHSHEGEIFETESLREFHFIAITGEERKVSWHSTSKCAQAAAKSRSAIREGKVIIGHHPYTVSPINNNDPKLASLMCFSDRQLHAIFHLFYLGNPEYIDLINWGNCRDAVARHQRERLAAKDPAELLEAFDLAVATCATLDLSHGNKWYEVLQARSLQKKGAEIRELLAGRVS